MSTNTAAVARAPRGAGLRLGLLYGPAIYGVSAAAVALPAAVDALHTTPIAAVWILTAHALGLGVATATAGLLADSYGTRRILTTGALLLATGAAICVIAPGLLALVAGRLLLAAGSGAVTAAAMTTAAQLPEHARPRALATIGVTLACVSATATLAGGLSSLASWRLPMILPASALLLVPLALPLTRRRPGSGPRADLPGITAVAMTAAGGLLLIQAHTLRLPAAAAAAVLAMTVAAAILTVRRHRRRKDAGVLHVVLADAQLRAAAVVGAGVYGGMFAALYAIPHVLYRQHQYSAVDVGVVLLPGAAGAVLLARIASRYVPALGAVRVLAIVALTFGGFLASAAIAPHPAVLVAAVAVAFGAFSTAQTVYTGLVGQRAPQLRGSAIGIGNLTFFSGGAAGSAMCSALWQPVGLTDALAMMGLLPSLGAVFAVVSTLRSTAQSAGRRDACQVAR
ncbi:DHA2 family metal-tetracycline-proton antiporter-like MFS transporter [Catenuloplanes nepalensis]|uniref:Tetracycline resistance protein n=1 Tax=Catenuloplanes nepalensis TaxID=587533 RepID=A0ABT9MMB4_9ACTN|nr:MFS transporter [Catenuloplanes nepalensis]MDP9792578.1 DHA2 family metal-tetracycline-proton antiporter-like MFS transporter [Catenuloplanes nepalensis]